MSLSVSIFLTDFLSHSQFRETSGLIKSMHETLPFEHPIRKLMLPFTLGAVYSNRIYNELLREKCLYHRAFAFKYEIYSDICESK